ncbi:MAG: 2-C-methyl-D-erythritol 4-phosphate cytidylyltransferase [Chlorobi bacterium]|jgi:2-C-methyl-D-erythritol 4-phosphate cytidylyltransferase|nr:2-C-methyl-D-erythritol 4-phosphate cytidylyltransferase [Chlorobiota bacterium]
MNVGVILPAAGSGQRFGGDVPKQYRLLAGVPVIVRSIARLRSALGDVPVVVATDPVWRTRAEQLLGADVAVCDGGATRQESVLRALEHPSIAEVEIVVVHDAVRPLVSAALVRRVVEAAAEHGAAIPIVSPKDTVKLFDDRGWIETTLQRSRVGLVQTPQAFRRELLLDAHRTARADRFEATDDASVVEYAGYAVATVEGEETNIKITTPLDWLLAERIVETSKV